VFVRQATIPEAGHFCFLEARAAFNALLRDFFATTEAGAR
jgi:pimeloyl-ACP methyl ester carboxylesterase